jgi:hypothetical protein
MYREAFEGEGGVIFMNAFAFLLFLVGDVGDNTGVS